jgi:hypothetical protein
MTILLALAVCRGAAAAQMERSGVDQAIGKRGADQPGGVHKFSDLANVKHGL